MIHIWDHNRSYHLSQSRPWNQANKGIFHTPLDLNWCLTIECSLMSILRIFHSGNSLNPLQGILSQYSKLCQQGLYDIKHSYLIISTQQYAIDWFRGTLTIVGYLIPNPFFTLCIKMDSISISNNSIKPKYAVGISKQFNFKQLSLT